MNTFLDLWNSRRNEPWQALSDLNSFNRLFNDFDFLGDATGQLITPACSAEETDTHYVMTVDLPGMKKEDIHLDLTGEHLIIKATRSRENKKDRKGYSYEERNYGTYQRVFTLPNASTSEKVEAVYKDGVLRVAVPKNEEAKPKRISISSEDSSGFFGRLFSGKKTEEKEVA